MASNGASSVGREVRGLCLGGRRVRWAYELARGYGRCAAWPLAEGTAYGCEVWPLKGWLRKAQPLSLIIRE